MGLRIRLGGGPGPGPWMCPGPGSAFIFLLGGFGPGGSAWTGSTAHGGRG